MTWDGEEKYKMYLERIDRCMTCGKQADNGWMYIDRKSNQFCEDCYKIIKQFPISPFKILEKVRYNGIEWEEEIIDTKLWAESCHRSRHDAWIWGADVVLNPDGSCMIFADLDKQDGDILRLLGRGHKMYLGDEFQYEYNGITIALETKKR